ncbi:MAG: hypothetical protein MUE30_16725 [Spirosomaceae bacterium]|nr:hypothetical protein [Spirosomataceae bacterium]
MTLRKILVFFSFWLYSVVVKASDTLSIAQKDSVRRPPKLTYTINWDARSSFIDKKIVNIWGVNTGIKFGRNRSELTLGYYWLTFNSLLRLIDLRKDASKRINLGYYTKTDLYYFSLMYWPNIIENKRWRFSTPVELGIGATQSVDQNIFNDLMLWRRTDVFVPAQAGLFLKWKATRWVGLMVQGGYRYAIFQQNLPTNYNGPYYSFGFTTESAIFTDSYHWLKKQAEKRRGKKAAKRPLN